MADVEIKRKPVFTAESIKEQLYKGDTSFTGEKTWQSAEAQAKNVAGFQTEAYRSQYRDAIASAYDAYERNKAAIKATDLLGSSQTELVNEQKQALSEAYNTYANNLYSAESSIQQSLNAQLQEYDKLLTERAENMESYFNSYVDYYEYLREQYGRNLVNNTLWKEKFGKQVEVKDNKGNVTTEWQLKSYNELVNSMFNEDGSLNQIGVDFYDMMESFFIDPTMYKDIGIDDLPSYEDYLYSTNEDLYNWYKSADIYNYTKEGGVANTMKLMTGRASDDYEYSFLERAGGLTDKQIDNLFKPITDVVDKISDLGNDYSDDEMNNLLNNSINNIEKLSKDLGIYDNINDELKSLGIDLGFSGLLDVLKSSKYNSNTGTFDMEDFTTILGGPADKSQYNNMQIMAGVGALAGVGLMFLNPIAGIIALGASFAGSVMIESKKKEDLKVDKERYANNIKANYTALVNSMVSYAKQQQQKSNENFVAGLI